MNFTNKEAELKLQELLQLQDQILGNKKVSYSISKAIRKLEEELKEYFEIKNKSIEKYGRKDRNGNYSINSELYENKEKFYEALELFTDEMKEIINTEIEIPICEIKIDDFNDNVTPHILNILDFLIAE